MAEIIRIIQYESNLMDVEYKSGYMRHPNYDSWGYYILTDTMREFMKNAIVSDYGNMRIWKSKKQREAEQKKIELWAAEMFHTKKELHEYADTLKAVWQKDVAAVLERMAR